MGISLWSKSDVCGSEPCRFGLEERENTSYPQKSVDNVVDEVIYVARLICRVSSLIWS